MFSTSSLLGCLGLCVVLGAAVGVILHFVIKRAYEKGVADTERRLLQMRLDAAEDAELALVWRRESLKRWDAAEMVGDWSDAISRSLKGTQIIRQAQVDNSKKVGQ